VNVSLNMWNVNAPVAPVSVEDSKLKTARHLARIAKHPLGTVHCKSCRAVCDTLEVINRGFNPRVALCNICA
jgi:hypothetical protein